MILRVRAALIDMGRRECFYIVANSPHCNRVNPAGNLPDQADSISLAFLLFMRYFPQRKTVPNHLIAFGKSFIPSLGGGADGDDKTRYLIWWCWGQVVAPFKRTSA
jgi:hypothetical protein